MIAPLTRAALLGLLVLALGVVGAACGGQDSAADSDDVRSTMPSEQDEDEDATADGEDGEADADAAPEPDAPPVGELPPIHVTSPKSFETVVGSMILEGTARTFEGNVRWEILDEAGDPHASGFVTASCGAPCRGKFRERISLRRVPLGSWELHVWEDNVADEGPARLHEQMLPITVSDQKVEGAPEPDAPPPGGVPE